ncbi:ubiquitin-like protein [Aspergillus ellipticus CBS 707.79]|uniref:Ubiquitin-like protein n=1 Tax=Aspergillus ellipticus CBS 707.79 TaxID=1448320 RepID=A0A319D8Y2_9EURO|nr:ubiquitin-like protein [Aspergillus ellipticus CBS 707.79]
MSDNKVDPHTTIPGFSDPPQLAAFSVPSLDPVEPLSPIYRPETAEHESQVPGSSNTDPADVGDNTTLAPDSKQSPVDAAPSASTSAEGSDEAKATAAAPEPSSQKSEEAAKDEDDSGPSLVITLLLITGSRHPFKIDGKYLRKRSVNVENNDPFAMSVYTLKELIWREWRQDWEPRPSSPSSIRLISMGKLLDDKAPLSDSKFNRDAPTVVHMTVKPQDLVDEEDAKGSKTQYSRERESSERSPGCRCIIQ